MKVEQRIWGERGGWIRASGVECPRASLVLLFGGRSRLTRPEIWELARQSWNDAAIVACSTAGEIAGTRVLDEQVVATAVEFASTRVEVFEFTVSEASQSRAAGEALAERANQPGLSHVLVLSDGLHVNGSELAQGLSSRLPKGVLVTGGLSADGTKFERTLVCSNQPRDGANIIAIGLYGEKLKVGVGSLGGWDPFGPDRVVTRSAGNVLYELDGKPALDLYKRYLGDAAADLPASALLFPLAISSGPGATEVVRTVLGVSEEDRSMTFAGDIPTGWRARLMHANFDRLVEGAAGAARGTLRGDGAATPGLGLLISCVGRKLVLKQRIEEEVEAVRRVLGPGPVLTGFYSYGEISPFTHTARCELHNQTMTITTFCES